MAAKRSLALVLADDRGGQRSVLLDRWHDSMRLTAAALLNRAQRHRVVRADLDVSDLLGLANGLAVASIDGNHA